jgi:outer membrane protein OmpA-like peptidoglycan-associated protein
MRPVSIFRSLTFFKPGEFGLETQSQDQLKAIIGALQQIAPTKVSVRSYTTELNDATANQKLAEQRATTVKQVLAKNKVPSQCQNVPCIKTNGFAQLDPPIVKQQIEIEAE